MKKSPRASTHRRSKAVAAPKAKSPVRRAVSKTRRVLKNPLIIGVVLIGLLWWGWHVYIAASYNFSEVPLQANLLPGGSFDTVGGNGLPDGWQAAKNGMSTYRLRHSKGYVGGGSLSMDVNNYKNGDITLTSPVVTVQTGQHYFYKGYYLTTTNFDFLVKYYFQDGTSRLELVQRYPDSTDLWSTVSEDFQAFTNLRAVQFVYRLSSNGTLQLDNSYLIDKADGLYLPASQPHKTNLIPNPELQPTEDGQPQDWLSYSAGTNQTAFSYVHTPQETYLHLAVSEYKNGEAKWQYLPQKVSPGQYFAFSATYRSTMPVEVVAEYELANGQRRFQVLEVLQPASEWTKWSTQYGVPSGAQNMFVSLVVHTKGNLDTRQYELYDLTKQGKLFYDRPLISLTFDDGWQSDYTNGARLLDTYGYKGTFYLNSSTIGTDVFMNMAQLQNLRDRVHQLAAHGHQHLDMTAIRPAEIDYQFKRSHDFILQRSIQESDVDFASPYGKSDAEVQWYVQKYFRSHRGTETGINTRQNFDPTDLKVIFISSSTPLQSIKDAIAEAQAEHGWLIFVYHRIEDNTKASTVITQAAFKQQLDLIKQSGITVKTVDGAMLELSKH